MIEKNTQLDFILAKQSDAEKLLEMISEFYEYDSISFDKKAVHKALQDIIDNDSFGKVFLLKVHKEIVGYMVITFGYSLEFHGRDAFIDEIYFKKANRGKGYGKLALAFAEKVCMENEIQALHLEVERSNIIAQNFYRKARFEDHDRYLMTKWIKD